ncbi:MAG: GNAT family N-acetyltransferase [Bacteroidota bacterium]|nr:GNAT family N-acetyltransferase [Bacteroidota bacterium]
MPNRNLLAFPTLTTERLTLRQLLESDVQEIFLLRSDPIANKYLDREPSKTLEDALNFIIKINENIKNSEVPYWAITRKNNERLIGTICLFDFSEELKRCEIGYELLTGYQGQGIMKEAVKKIIEYSVEVLGVKTIDACSHKDNQSSIKLLQKLNFEKTEIVDETNPNLIVFRLLS